MAKKAPAAAEEIPSLPRLPLIRLDPLDPPVPTRFINGRLHYRAMIGDTGTALFVFDDTQEREPYQAARDLFIGAPDLFAVAVKALEAVGPGPLRSEILAALAKASPKREPNAPRAGT